ncbi:hypothetical protein ABFT23_20190 [Nocardioides sp. C4-1]|uniref:hypothetical protein n=1 Tax=Nocardioides sp. C4-1 TaxID=3151851 RepID=UPI003265415A
MRQPEDFDAFYKDARERLLAQTYAVTGDVGASRRAVRDAFIVAWHRWRKISRLDDPEAVVRPHAWRLAQRNHSARVWHREKDISDEVRDILDALGTLTTAQRRVVVLRHLSTVPMAQLAREVGLPLEQAERELASGDALLALELDVETSDLDQVLDILASSVAGRGRWPRATIVRRSGAARRRTHTVIGVVAAVAAVVVTGTLVTESGGVRPTLAGPTGSSPAAPSTAPDDEEEVPVTLPQDSLLTTADLAGAYDGRTWTLTRTADNSAGNGIAIPCQRERYADPRGKATLVRYFKASPVGGGSADGPTTTVTQLTEESANARAAQRTMRTTAGWVAGCTEPRVQLLATRTPREVGDEAVQLVLRRWTAPVQTWVVGIARSGRYTTTAATVIPGDVVPDREAAAVVLGAAARGVCRLPGAGGCAPGEPVLVDRDPLPAEKRAALLSEVDLPPVNGVDEPWVGTDPVRPATNPAATGCDRTSFTDAVDGVAPSRGATRTFVVPGAELPQEFGLTETVAALPRARAEAFVAGVRDRLASCPERDLNTEVDEVARTDDGPRSLTAWRLDVKVTDDRSVVFFMAVIRNGTSIAQLGFVPTDDATLADGAFVALAERAQQRLGALPRPS